MKNLFHRLIHQGVDDFTPSDLVDEIKVINAIKIQGAILVIIGGLTTMYFLPEYTGFILLLLGIHVASAVGVLTLNAAHAHELSKWVFVLDPALLILLLTFYFGVESNLHYIGLLCFMMFVFQFRGVRSNEPTLLAVYLITVVTGVSIAFGFDIHLADPPRSVIETLRVVAFAMSVGLSVLMSVILSSSTRKRTERAKETLRASQKDAVILQSISDSMEEAIFKSSVSRGFVFVNEAFAGMFGYEDKDDILATHPVNLYVSKVERESLLARIWEEGRVSNELMQYRKKDGSYFWGRLNCQRLFEQDEVVLVGTIVDVTGQQEQTELLKLSERRLRDAQRLAKLGNWRIVPGEGVVEWSAEGAHIHGFLPNDYEDPFTEWLDRLEGITREEIEEQIRRCEAMNVDYEFGAWYQTPSGEAKYLNYICKVEYEQKRRVWYGTVQDNTELKNQELELVSTREFYQNILTAIPVETVLIDEELKYFYISENAIMDEELRAWLIGKTNKEYAVYRGLPPAFGEERDGQWQKAFDSDLTVRWEEQMITRDGRTSYHLRNVVPINLSFGKQTKRFLIGYSFDINDIKNAQFRLEQKNDELTVLNRELDRFVYSISHDLRAPIASVLGLNALAEECEDDEELQGILDMQREALDRLDQYIRDVIDYARNKRMDVTPEDVNLNNLVWSCLRGLDYLADYQRLEYFIEVPEDLEVSTDRVRMQIILSNLFSNAIKYSDPSKDKSFLSVRTEVKDGQLILEVADNGLGISDEFKEQIWDIFFRGNSDVSGSGLGLYILKESVKNMGGTIEVESEEGKGTTFTLLLPPVETA